MPRTYRRKSGTGMYHVFARGINQELIFNQKREKQYFKKILKKHLKQHEIEIYAYCIMSSHVHLMIKSKKKEELSIFMSKVLAEYAGYYNYKKNRNGHVFQNRFRSECIENIFYFLNCLKYIHLNPVKANMVSAVWKYEFSSMNDYRDEKTGILHKNAMKFYKQKFSDWSTFLEYHYSGATGSFLDTKMAVYIQQKDMAREILRELQKNENLETEVEVFEQKEIRYKFLCLLKERLRVSDKVKKKIYEDIKDELMNV